jgi:hypothetical protein
MLNANPTSPLRGLDVAYDSSDFRRSMQAITAGPSARFDSGGGLLTLDLMKVSVT